MPKHQGDAHSATPKPVTVDSENPDKCRDEGVELVHRESVRLSEERLAPGVPSG